MASYPVPPDFSEKEKIVGGLLTAQQLICLIAGVALDAIFSLMTFPFMGAFSIILNSIIFLPIGLLFALYRPKGMSLLTYIKKKQGHKSKTKKLPNTRQICDNFEISYRTNKNKINSANKF